MSTFSPTKHARQASRVVAFAGVTAACARGFERRKSRLPASAHSAERDLWTGRFATATLRIFGVELETIGCVPRSDRGLLVVANHRSTIDIGVLLKLAGGRLVAKAEIAEWPLLGYATRAVDTIFVERENAVSGMATVRAIASALRGGGVVSVFPEGTTFATDEVMPFHAGAFLGAIQANADVLPVGLAYEHGSGAAFVGETFAEHLARVAGTKRTRVVAVVGEPIAVASRMRAKELAERARAEVFGLVAQARDRVDRRAAQ